MSFVIRMAFAQIVIILKAVWFTYNILKSVLNVALGVNFDFSYWVTRTLGTTEF